MFKLYGREESGPSLSSGFHLCDLPLNLLLLELFGAGVVLGSPEASPSEQASSSTLVVESLSKPVQIEELTDTCQPGRRF